MKIEQARRIYYLILALRKEVKIFPEKRDELLTQAAACCSEILAAGCSQDRLLKANVRYQNARILAASGEEVKAKNMFLTAIRQCDRDVKSSKCTDYHRLAILINKSRFLRKLYQVFPEVAQIYCGEKTISDVFHAYFARMDELAGEIIRDEHQQISLDYLKAQAAKIQYKVACDFSASDKEKKDLALKCIDCLKTVAENHALLFSSPYFNYRLYAYWNLARLLLKDDACLDFAECMAIKDDKARLLKLKEYLEAAIDLGIIEGRTYSEVCKALSCVYGAGEFLDLDKTLFYASEACLFRSPLNLQYLFSLTTELVEKYPAKAALGLRSVIFYLKSTADPRLETLRKEAETLLGSLLESVEPEVRYHLALSESASPDILSSYSGMKTKFQSDEFEADDLYDWLKRDIRLFRIDEKDEAIRNLYRCLLKREGLSDHYRQVLAEKLQSWGAFDLFDPLRAALGIRVGSDHIVDPLPDTSMDATPETGFKASR